MIYLFISIFFATMLVVILKLFVRWGIPQHYGIVYNYGVCVLIGWIANGSIPSFNYLTSWEGSIPSLSLGILFFSIFNIIALSSKYLGIGITSIAFKISFIIPVVAAVILYNEPIHFQLIAAVVCALGAVVSISTRKDTPNIPGAKPPLWVGILPLAIFIGSGLNDAFLNYIQASYLQERDNHLFNALIFTAAFLFGFLLFFHKKEFWRIRYLLGGILLGIPNYGSIYFLILAMQNSGMRYSLLFPAYNLGIILTGVVIGLVLFGEKMERAGYYGLILAAVALGFIAWAG